MNDLALPVDNLSQDNITDWALEIFQNKYGKSVSKDDIWHYIYGVMHAKDWREKYKYDLQRELPRIPLAEDFRAFVGGGRSLWSSTSSMKPALSKTLTVS